MPENAIYVGRPTQWGNLFTVDATRTAIQAVKDFRVYVLSRLSDGTGYPLQALCGKDLACWCALSDPCHADVLIELANNPKYVSMEVLAWAKTSHGGRQTLLPIMHERPACESKYGLCE